MAARSPAKKGVGSSLPTNGPSERLGVAKHTRSRKRGPVERRYVAIDLHRLRSLIVREDEGGDEVGVVRIDNDPLALAAAVAEAGPEPQVAMEATYGWYWAVDVLEELGAEVKLVNPSGLAWGDRRVKNDYRDCKELLDRMRLHKLPEAWIAPPLVRELRELVRYRFKLVCLRTGLKAQVKAVLAKHGLHPPVNDLWGLAGTAYLNSLELDNGYHIRIESLRDRWSTATGRSPCSSGSSTSACAITQATGPSRSSTAWARSWPPSSSPRSATSVASPTPRRCARGRA